jgi:putative protein kinase ArgK-like GTPase of G3E family
MTQIKEASFVGILGDGTGVGKSLMIAGVILNNFEKGRKKAVWLSASPLLEVSARAGLEMLGFRGETILLDRLKQQTEGVLFLTYSSLGSDGGKNTEVTRFQEVLNWLGADFDGVVSVLSIE